MISAFPSRDRKSPSLRCWGHPLQTSSTLCWRQLTMSRPRGPSWQERCSAGWTGMLAGSTLMFPERPDSLDEVGSESGRLKAAPPGRATGRDVPGLDGSVLTVYSDAAWVTPLQTTLVGLVKNLLGTVRTGSG